MFTHLPSNPILRPSGDLDNTHVYLCVKGPWPVDRRVTHPPDHGREQRLWVHRFLKPLMTLFGPTFLHLLKSSYLFSMREGKN